MSNLNIKLEKEFDFLRKYDYKDLVVGPSDCKSYLSHPEPTFEFVSPPHSATIT